MTLSDEDQRRIEEKFRKLARERRERTVMIEADTPTPSVEQDPPKQPSPATEGDTVAVPSGVYAFAFIWTVGTVPMAVFYTKGIALIPLAMFAWMIWVHNPRRKK
jgi:hypothetical protein